MESQIQCFYVQSPPKVFLLTITVKTDVASIGGLPTILLWQILSLTQCFPVLWPPCHSQITSWMFLPRNLCTCPSSCGVLISQTVTKLSCLSFRSCLKCHLIKEALPDCFKIAACWLCFLLLSIYFAILYYLYSTYHVLTHNSFACLFPVCVLTRLMENRNLLCSLQ